MPARLPTLQFSHDFPERSQQRAQKGFVSILLNFLAKQLGNNDPWMRKFAKRKLTFKARPNFANSVAKAVIERWGERDIKESIRRDPKTGVITIQIPAEGRSFIFWVDIDSPEDLLTEKMDLFTLIKGDPLPPLIQVTKPPQETDTLGKDGHQTISVQTGTQTWLSGGLLASSNYLPTTGSIVAPQGPTVLRMDQPMQEALAMTPSSSKTAPGISVFTLLSELLARVPENYGHNLDGILTEIGKSMRAIGNLKDQTAQLAALLSPLEASPPEEPRRKRRSDAGKKRGPTGPRKKK